MAGVLLLASWRWRATPATPSGRTSQHRAPPLRAAGAGQGASHLGPAGVAWRSTGEFHGRDLLYEPAGPGARRVGTPPIADVPADWRAAPLAVAGRPARLVLRRRCCATNCPFRCAVARRGQPGRARVMDARSRSTPISASTVTAIRTLDRGGRRHDAAPRGRHGAAAAMSGAVPTCIMARWACRWRADRGGPGRRARPRQVVERIRLRRPTTSLSCCASSLQPGGARWACTPGGMHAWPSRSRPAPPARRTGARHDELRGGTRNLQTIREFMDRRLPAACRGLRDDSAGRRAGAVERAAVSNLLRTRVEIDGRTSRELLDAMNRRQKASCCLRGGSLPLGGGRPTTAPAGGLRRWRQVARLERLAGSRGGAGHSADRAGRLAGVRRRTRRRRAAADTHGAWGH